MVTTPILEVREIQGWDGQRKVLILVEGDYHERGRVALHLHDAELVYEKLKEILGK